MTKLWPRTEVNKAVAAIELAFKGREGFNAEKTTETIKLTAPNGNVIFRALKTNGPWLCTFPNDLFE